MTKRCIHIVLATVIVGGCAPVVNGPSSINGEVGVPLLPVRIEASNSPQSFAAANLPEGLAMPDSQKGEIVGTPLRAGSFVSTLSASNASGTGSKDIEIQISKLSHPVVWQKELFITHRNVLTDRRATEVGGPWHFSTLMRRLAGTDDNGRVSEFTLSWLREWSEKNHHVVNEDPDHRARDKIEVEMIKPWISASSGGAADLDWSKAPFRLIGIVNRIDLTKFSNPDTLQPQALGEARLIFADKGGRSFYAIFEFGIPGARTKENLITWARKWRLLGDPIQFGGETEFGENYLAQLQMITDAYATQDGMKSGQVRTNEFVIGSPWELREFKLAGGRLKQEIVAQTPQIRFNRAADRQVLLNYLNQNAEAIVRHQHQIPLSFDGRKFAGGVSPFEGNNSGFKWTDPGLTDPRKDAIRFGFSFNTCAGCHGGDGRGQGFVHIRNHIATDQSHLSQFLRGEIASFDEAGNTKQHNESDGRKKILARIAAGESIQSAVRHLRVRKPEDVISLFKSLMDERVSRVH